MDCLVLPIQNKLEEWKKITHALDKEHAKGKPLAYYLGNLRVCNFCWVLRSFLLLDKEHDKCKPLAYYLGNLRVFISSKTGKKYNFATIAFCK